MSIWTTMIRPILSRWGLFGQIVATAVDALLAENAAHPEILAFLLSQAKQIASLTVTIQQTADAPAVVRPATNKEKQAEAVKRVEDKAKQVGVVLSEWAKNMLVESIIPSVK